MFTQMTFLKRILLSAILLSLIIVRFFLHLTDTTVVDLISGFSHPLEGWDHFVTMLAVGIWAAQLRGKAIWLLPLTFVSVMSLGGISGAARYLAVPSAEVLILFSCLVFSVLIIRKVRFDIKINVLIVAFFAFFHGYAHGQEISASASLISYTIGFMIATLLLHGAGILVAKLLLISVTFFVAQALHAAPSESTKTVAVNPSICIGAFEQRAEVATPEKLPLIKSSQWLNLSPPLEQILSFYKPQIRCGVTVDVTKTGIQHLANGVGLTSPPCEGTTYCVFASLFLIYIVSQFFCYVFYPTQQHCDFVFVPACCFKKSLYLLTLPAFQLSHFPSHISLFQQAVFVRSKFFNFNPHSRRFS